MVHRNNWNGAGVQDESQFEIHADHGSGWSLLGVVNQQDDAEARAHDAKQDRRALAVKVIRTTYDESAGEFVERRVLYLGEPRPLSKAAAEGNENEPVCLRASDLYRPPARRAMRRHLRQWLETARLTPIELLHHPDYVIRLDDAGSALQSAVQRSAMAQARRGGGDVQKRQRALFDLIDDAIGTLRSMWRSDRRPHLQSVDVDGLTAQIAEGEMGALQFNAALTEWLQPQGALADKMLALLELLRVAELPRTLALLDNFLTDFVAEPACSRLLLGEDMELGDAVLKSIAMITGRDWADADESAAGHDFIARLQAGQLPKCRQVLVRRVIVTVASQKSFGSGQPMVECTFNQSVRKALKGDDDEYLGGDEMKAALIARSERLVTPDAIGRLTTGKSKALARMNAMLDLDAGVFGAANKKRLGEFVLAVLDQPANQKELAENSETPTSRMRSLAQLQKRVKDARLERELQGRIVTLLDELCAGIMKRERILQRLSSSADDPVNACINVLKLCAAGTFTEGSAADQARAHAMRYLSSPNFLDDYLRGVGQRDKLKRRLMELEGLLDAADMVRVPLGVVAGS